MIEKYNFTSIIIDDKEYFNDVKVSKYGVEEWKRNDNHLVQTVDLRCALNEKPNIIIVGIANPDLLEITPEAENFIEETNVCFVVEPIKKAIQTYNILSKFKNVVALLSF